MAIRIQLAVPVCASASLPTWDSPRRTASTTAPCCVDHQLRFGQQDVVLAVHGDQCSVPGTREARSSCDAWKIVASCSRGTPGGRPIGFGNRTRSRECSSTTIGI